jgi:CRP-like cAMP-binding protein
MNYEIWAFPFRLAFCDPSLKSFIFMMDVTSDSIFCLDIFVRMCELMDIALKKNDDPILEGKVMMEIIQNSISSDLSYNIASVVPYYAATARTSRLIEYSFDSSRINTEITAAHWIWWLSTLPRCIIRANRLFKLRSIASVDIRSNIHAEGAKNISIFIVLSAHCIGCVYFFMSRMRSLDVRTWVFSIEQTLKTYHRFHSTLWEHYLLALFKGFSTISGFEYTKYLANNLEEQFAVIAMTYVQLYFFALLFGTTIHYMGLRDPLAEQAAEKLSDLRAYIQLNQLPPELEAKLVRGLQFQHRKMELDNVDAEIELSQSLQLKAVKSKFGSLLQRGCTRGRLFFECNEHFLNELLVHFNVLYFMAGQDIVKKGDISQELIILVDGAVDIINDSEESVSTISSSSPDIFPCVGEVAFFLGIMQPHTVRARPQEDVRAVALSRDGSEALLAKFPDQREVIFRNILHWYGLDLDGSDLTGASGAEADVHSETTVREQLQKSILRRREEAFAGVIIATKEGELEVVMRLSFAGIELMTDYDGRTLLSHAVVAGAYKVAEFLLELRADVNHQNRWEQTPLDEAMRARQQTMAQLLLQHRGVMGPEAMSSTLIDISSGLLETSPDAEILSRIIRQCHVDPNVGDYDRRTALHLACAKGNLKTAELLIGLRADVNATDRWQGTPLADAVLGGHMAVASLLHSKGARMSAEVRADFS